MRFRLTLAAAAALALLSTASGYSAGGGGDSTPQCGAGKVYDQKTKKCVSRSSSVDDDSLYAYGRMLAKSGAYDDAITVLSLAKNKNDARILNYLGYSHRMAGRILVGLGYYQEALAVDPDSVLVREYLGEAHLQLGDVKSAEGQLAEIERRCGKGCAEYAELASRIEAWRVKS